MKVEYMLCSAEYDSYSQGVHVDAKITKINRHMSKLVIVVLKTFHMSLAAVKQTLYRQSKKTFGYRYSSDLVIGQKKTVLGL